jgi:transcriptional regulator with XRE-family HTH domain
MTKKVELNVDVRSIVGKKVRRLRNEAALSQELLSAHCGIFRTYLSRIEGGTANPSITVVAALATALGVNITELFME